MNQVVPMQPSMSKIESVLIAGDLSKLTQQEREVYYMETCSRLGLNPLARPFDYITLNGKLVLYANKGCAEQLRSIRKISITVTAREMLGDLCVVTANAKGSDGREDSSTGAVNVSNLKGEMLANAMMKAETKAKRRVTLSICGLNMLDESEVETIPDAKPVIGNNVITPTGPGPDDGNQDNGYRIPAGQWKGLTVEEVFHKFGPEKVKSYITYLETKFVPLLAWQVEFVSHAEVFLGGVENAVMKEDGQF